MAVDPERWPPWRDRVVRTTRRLTDGYATQESASAGETYDIFLERLDVIRSAAAERGVRLRDALDAQGLAWTIAGDFSSPSWSPDVQRAYTEWKAGRSKSGPEAAEVQPEAPLGRGETEPSASVVAASIDDLADRLSLAIDDTPWLQETIELLLEKRQLILQGPPGTGKTFVAREIAWFLAGGRERVQLVQFHPGYSYEDFVAGLRPDPHEPTRFTVVPGPLLRMADRARQEPEERFVLIIDELNRGNVPAVFGELYFLLEYRDEHATLTYGGPPFSLPPNLFFIATMNTADRSITSLDAALRRRFYVRDLEPGAPPLDGIMRRYLAERAPAFAWLADLVDQANEVIGDRDQAIGPSHFLRPDISEVSARRAWEHAVIPTLRELFWSQPARLEPLQFDALKAKVTQTSADTAPD